MHHTQNMNRASKVFFALFFVGIIASLTLTYWTIVVREDYVVFKDEDSVPEPTDFVGQLFGVEGIEQE